MGVNIRCAIPGCTNPVIGQCPGYIGSCGKFYCNAHSTGNLCVQCANRKTEVEAAETKRKLEQEIAQRVYQDYLQTAEQTFRDIRAFSTPIVLIIILLNVFALFSLNNDTIPLLAFGGAILLMVIGAIAQSLFEKKKLAEISRTKPNFPEFYKAWKKQKDKKALKTGFAVAGVLAAIVFGVAAAASKASRDDL